TDGNGISIDTTPVGTDAWQPSPTVLQLGGGPIPGAQVVLHGAAGWIVENDRVVIAGARLVNGGWQPWTPPCQSTGGPATLAAPSATTLVALCDEGLFGGNNLGEYLNRSTDGGTTFAQLGNTLPYSDMQSLTAAPGSQTIVASAYGTTPELVASFNDGATWETVYQPLAGGSGFTDLGFTTAAQGVAVEVANGPLGTLLMTHDGGHTWTPVTFGSGASPSQ
ncbi:MAG TPA: hypothetical protein VHA57_03090, partial [Actinomycetota bacterium]|nr:hypothetical protein [Actinomycetota bacterium]